MLPDGLDDNEVVAAIEEWDSEAIVAGVAARGEVTLIIQLAKIHSVCRFLREGHGFARLSSLTAVDRHPADPRFEVVYHLHSVVANERLRLKCCLPETSAEIDSVTEVWAGADWYEREVFDLFGILFRGHPNLKRILMPDDWVGHPLRKDFPVDGNKYGYQDE